MVINLISLPQEEIDEYNLLNLVHYGCIYIEIQKGVYGMPQSGILANELLQRQLSPDWYRPNEHTHGFWKQETQPV
jgi:hypothetical protein